MKLPPHIALARRSEQRVSLFRGNRLIEALPLAQSDEKLFDSLFSLPEYDSSERFLESHERMSLLLQLLDFMVPLEAHLLLARQLDALLRNGYVNRVPGSPEHVHIFHNIYERDKQRTTFRPSTGGASPRMSTAIVGLPGMGKSSTIRRLLGQMHQVYYHEELGVYQITYLHVDMPADGKSVKGWCAAILQQVDTLIPGATYYKDYFGNGRVSTDALIRSVARVLNMHFVGLIVCDEVQNLANSAKGEQVVMTELVSLTNAIGVPLVFIGTYKAERILGLDLRQARRSIGFGAGDWGALPQFDENGDAGEWEDFIRLMWDYQWVRNPVELTDKLLDKFYDLTQGVIDLAIKLFIAAQARAMSSGDEELSEGLLEQTYLEDMKAIHPMVEALRSGDKAALEQFDDLCTTDMETFVESLKRRMRRRRVLSMATRPDDKNFVPQLAAAAQAVGLHAEDAVAIAEEIAQQGSAKNMVEGLAEVVTQLKPPKKASNARAKSKVATEPVYDVDLSDRPQDYRRAVEEARKDGKTVLETLVKLGMALPADQHFALS